jgi:hypothetical protein
MGTLYSLYTCIIRHPKAHALAQRRNMIILGIKKESPGEFKQIFNTRSGILFGISQL